MHVRYTNGKTFTVVDTKRFIRHLGGCKESKHVPGYFYDFQVHCFFTVSDYPGSKALTRTEIYERE